MNKNVSAAEATAQKFFFSTLLLNIFTKGWYRHLSFGYFLLLSLFASVDVERSRSNIPGPSFIASIGSGARVDVMDNLFGITFGPGGRDKIQNYLKEGANPNLVDSESKQSLLEIFCFKGDEEMVGLLINKGAFVPYLDENGHHALYCISSLERKDYREEHNRIADRLIEHVSVTWGKNIAAEMINQADSRRITSLHIASVRGHRDVVHRLIRSGAHLDQGDFQGRTALHFACYMGHDDIITDLLDYKASPELTSHKGLKAKDFFKLGELEEDLRRNPRIEQRLGGDQDNRQREERKRMQADESLREFLITFQRKCTSIFLAYKTLESGAIQGEKDILSVSNAINILGNIIPLPGCALVTLAISGAAGVAEDHIESKKKKMITELFATVKEMEEAVEDSAYALARRYEESIRALKTEGAVQLAECGVARFITYMRDPNTALEKEKPLSDYVLESVQFKNNSYLERFSFWKNRVALETRQKQVRWTDRDIFQSDTQAPLSVHQDNQLGEVNDLDTHYQDRNQDINSHVVTKHGCCVVS